MSAPDREDVAGELEHVTLGQVARAARWGRVAVAAAWAALLACAAALGFWFETRKHAAEVAGEQAKETAELRTEVRVVGKLQDYQRAEFETIRRQLWRIADRVRAEKVPAPKHEEE